MANNSRKTNYSAVSDLLHDTKNRRLSTTSAKRVVAACKVLMFSQQETVAMLRYLGYCNADGSPYKGIDKVW